MSITEACHGGQLVYTLPSGVFSTKGSNYENNERCHWKIEVEKRKVRICHNCCDVYFDIVPKIT